ncbi:PREDICTED: uncharacterized protein LOC105460898 [Wasmannia auropunctata]|uniref:uncharacterized protein LOC105460898 n=1 Tax=Wasmannia auropunctata TaxID=64793 RepID=UPI0005ED6EE2|nr:PREDICTED: uncharacterized protein LOC105460898 [Wasmannia auropunctata]
MSSNFQEESKGKQKRGEWRLFHAKDFQSLMRPCFTFCRILGVFPYTINASTFEMSKPYCILSIIVTCVCNIYALITMFNSSVSEKIDMLNLPAFLADRWCFMLGDFIITVTFILTRPRIRLLQTILKISSRLPAESYEKLSRLIHAKDIIGLICLIGLMLPHVYTLQINILLQVYINLVVFQMDMLYMNCICILKMCFKRINDNLAQMRKSIANKEPHVLRLLYHEQRSPLLIMELKALEKQHLIISNTVQKLNIIFNLQLFATVAIICHNIIFNVFYNILSLLFHLLTDTPINLSYHVYFLLNMGQIFTKIALIVWACETSKHQALLINTSIHDVLNCTIDEHIRDELQLFSLQTLHCNNTFCVKGFAVDAKLLIGILGSVATHVFIMVQFVLVSCEEKSGKNVAEIIYNKLFK